MFGVSHRRFWCFGLDPSVVHRSPDRVGSSTGRTPALVREPARADPVVMSVAALPPSPLPLSSLDFTLLTQAAAQHGVLSTAQLLGAGLTARRLVELVRADVLLHPGRGLYLVAALARSDEAERHRQLVAGAFLLYPDAVLTGTTALMAHGIPVWGVPLGRPALRRPMKRSGGMSAFWVRQASGGSVATTWGPASPVAEALAVQAVDHGIVAGVVSADAALRDGHVDADALAAAVAGVSGWVHGSRAVAMLALANGRRESVGESRCGVALSMAQVPVVPQVVVRDRGGRFVARVDFVVEGTKVVIEFDGKVKYGSGDPEVLWAEKRREDELRALGYVVVRITWADLEVPGAVAAKVRAALASAT